VKDTETDPKVRNFLLRGELSDNQNGPVKRRTGARTK
jgi:hypothetical protein